MVTLDDLPCPDGWELWDPYGSGLVAAMGRQLTSGCASGWGVRAERLPSPDGTGGVQWAWELALVSPAGASHLVTTRGPDQPPTYPDHVAAVRAGNEVLATVERLEAAAARRHQKRQRRRLKLVRSSTSRSTL
jgi:hypothetical protein